MYPIKESISGYYGNRPDAVAITKIYADVYLAIRGNNKKNKFIPAARFFMFKTQERSCKFRRY